jgi:hypothetical protein
VGLTALILIKVLAPGFYARQDVRTPVKIAIMTLIFTQLMNAVFIVPLQHAGLALAISLGACLNAGALLHCLRVEESTPIIDYKGAEQGALPQSERLFCLINAPANGDGAPLQPSDLQSCEDATFRHLDRCGLTVTPLEAARVVTTPADFARMFPGSGGALYGPAQHGWMASFARPGARTRLPGLYLAGGGAHPGPGVPMAALSGRQAALSVMTDLASTAWSRPAATPGGMSMRSATTGNMESPSSPSSAASSPPGTPGPDARTRSTTVR